MRRLLEFIRSTYVFLIFVVLETAALNHYARSSVYARAKILSRAAYVAGGINGGLHEVKRYFSLGRENDELLARLAELENRLSEYESGAAGATGATGAAGIAGVAGGISGAAGMEFTDGYYDPMWAKFVYMTAEVVSLSVNKLNNLMIIDKGMDDGVRTQMGVVSPRGAMVGYVVGCSNRYSAVLPIINTSFRSSGMLLGGNHSAPISWNGHGMYEVQLAGLSKYAKPEVGDTIVSTGHSNIFPRGILIGRVKQFEMNEIQTAYNIEVELATDISALHRVILIDNRDLDEIQNLRNETEGQN